MGRSVEGGYRTNKPHGSGTEGNILVSVVTVVYNGEKHLEQTIQSVLHQDYPHLEYIVIDGGSTDGTLAIIRKYENQIAYWKSEPDKGISDAFNKGIAQASGELVGIVNADDWYAPQAVSNIVAHYEANSVLHGNLQYWHAKGSKAHTAKPNIGHLPLEMSLNHPTVFVSKSLYDTYGVFSLNYLYAMDYQLLLRLYKEKIKFIYVDETITNMRLGGVSANIDACYREVFQAKEEVLGPKLAHKLYYSLTMLRYKMSKLLDSTPLAFINTFYRKHLSPIKRQS